MDYRQRKLKNICLLFLLLICFVLIIPCSRISYANDYSNSKKKINNYYTIEIGEYTKLKDCAEGSFYVYISLPSYHYYLVKTSDNEYLCVGINNKNNISLLDEADNGILANPIRIVGKLKRNYVDVDINDFDVDSTNADVSSYVIEEKSIKPYEYSLVFAYFISFVFLILNFVTYSVRKKVQEEYHTLDSYMSELSKLETKVDFINLNIKEYKCILKNKKIEAIMEFLYLISSFMILIFVNNNTLVICAVLICVCSTILLLLTLSNYSDKISKILYKHFKIKNVYMAIEDNKKEIKKIQDRIEELG